MAEDGRPPRQDPALDVSASAKVRPSEASCKFTLTIASERVAMLALAVAGAGVGVCALTTLWYKRPEAFKNAVSTAVGALGARVCKIWSGSIFVELCCDTKESLLSFVEAFEAKKVKQRLEEEFRKIGFAEKLEVTITDEKDVYEKVNKIRQEKERQEVGQEVGESSDSRGGETFVGSGYKTGLPPVDDPTIYLKTINDFWVAVRKKEQEGEDPTQIINEYKKAIQDAPLISAEMPSYYIMTINMGGKAKRDDRVLLSSTIMRTCSSSVIFCQEIPGHFERDVVKKCGTSDYGYAKEGHAAIIWRMEDFDGSTDGLETTDTSIREISDVLMGRIVMVKLTCRKSSDVVLAVSWHGPYTRYAVDERFNVFDRLITFLQEVCDENDIPSFLIGGSFNLNTSGEQFMKVTEAIKASVASYELSPRQAKMATNKNYIPYKDNFVFFSKDNKITVSWARPFEIEDPSEATTSDVTESAYADVQSEMASGEVAQVEEALDHDPIIGKLQFLSGPEETRNKGEAEIKQNLLPAFKKLAVSDK